MNRLTPKERKAQILQAALDIAAQSGVDRLVVSEVATRVGVTKGLVLHYFSTMPQLKRAVMRAAVKQEVVSVVARGLALDDPQARKAPDDLRAKAALYLAGQAA